MSGRREAALAAGAGGVLAVVMTWPLAARLGSVLPDSLADPSLLAWQFAWLGHALTGQPLALFQGNAFWPLPDSAAFTDLLLGYAPAGLLGSGLEAAVVRHNLLYLLAHALPFAGLYALARELGLRPAAAAVGAAAFAWTPWRLSQAGHLHVLSSGAIPLALFLLARGHRLGRPGLVLGGFAVATWQLSLGFTLGLQLVYLLGAVGLGWAVAVVAGWVPRPRRAVALAAVAGAALLVGWGALQARPLLEVSQAHPEARRSVAEVERYSPPAAGLVAAAPSSVVWGWTALGGPAPLERSLFPGAALLVLALAGAAAGPLRRRLRLALAAATAACAMLALGLGPLGDASPYRLLYELAPGWQAVRTPGRLMTLVTLGLALLAAAGAQALLARLGGRGRLPAAAAAAALVALVLVEGAGRRALPRVPPPPEGLAAVAGPRLHLPSSVVADPLFMLWSTDGFPAIANGYAGFEPRALRRVRAAARGFPSPAAADRLRGLGLRAVVIHPGLPLERLARRTPHEGAARRRAAAARRRDRAAARRPPPAGVRRRALGDAVVYELRPRR